MQVFYSNSILGNQARLEEDEFRHLKVLRKKEGDEVHLIDGKGSRYLARIDGIQSKNALLTILDQHQEAKANFPKLYIAPTKNIARMEWLVEKAVELGVDSIQFMQCEHSERKKIRIDRLEKIALSALKQSLQLHLPSLFDLKPFDECLEEMDGTEALFAHCAEDDEHISLSKIEAGKSVCLFIGPEGDFSTAEIAKAKEARLKTISLGEERLRTETAGMFGLAYFKIRRL